LFDPKLDVSLDRNYLKIGNNVEQKEGIKNDRAFSQSYPSKYFERYLTLPGPVKLEKLIIDYDKTELKISLKKRTI
jgi:HSP20 family molecular chaperone IbpA